jgi:hypothetical protein
LLEAKTKTLRYEDAFLVTEDVVHNFLGAPKFLDALISENILIDTFSYDSRREHEYYVTYGYERMGDHLKAKALVSSLPKVFPKNWYDEGYFAPIFKNANERKSNQGLINALSIQFPENFEVELYEMLPQ